MISNVLRGAIIACGESYAQIERKCGLGSGTLSRFMSGGRDIGLSAVDKITTYLGLRLTVTAEAQDASYVALAVVRDEVAHCREALRQAQESLEVMESVVMPLRPGAGGPTSENCQMET